MYIHINLYRISHVCNRKFKNDERCYTWVFFHFYIQYKRNVYMHVKKNQLWEYVPVRGTFCKNLI